MMKKSKLQYKYAVRRLKRAGESIQNNKFVDSIVNGVVNIYEQAGAELCQAQSSFS